MSLRCVVTSRRPRMLSDQVRRRIGTGHARVRAWSRVSPRLGRGQTPSAPDFVPISPTASFFPPVGGSRVIITTFPVQTAGASLDLDMAAVVAEAERKVPGMLAHMEPENPGMHTTNSVDVDIVLAGEVVLELDDGVEAVLRTGDMVVQNGTRHRWHNRGPVPAVLAAFLVGADHH
jgi:mannose-6-phosphate isomerase-like protein (cupin superfamily)